MTSGDSTVNVVDDLGRAVGEHWARLQNLSAERQQRFTYAVPLSSTPLPIYEWVVGHLDRFSGWATSRFVLMDEQVEQKPDGSFGYIERDDPASYERFAEEHFLRPLGRALGRQEPVQVTKPCLNALVDFDVVLDMLILAIGVDGNYANVMPGTDLGETWHIANLSPAFRRAHTSADSPSYSKATFREYGMSLGPRQVLEAKEVVVIASGARKAELFNRLMRLDAPDSSYPISIVKDRSVRDRVHYYLTPDVLTRD